MKRLVLLVSMLFVFIHPVWSQTPSSILTFDERVHDFGTVLEKNGKVTHRFVFHNKGKLPVVVNDIYSDCGCIGRVASKAPVKPGDSGEVAITFNPEYKAGFFSKEIVVYSDNSKSYNRIWVEGKVTPTEHPVEEDYPYDFGDGLYLRLKVMAFGYLKPGETKQMELHYANAINKPMTLNFSSMGNPKGLQFTNPGKIAAKARGIVNFSYTMPLSTKDDIVLTLYPYVDQKKMKEALVIKILNEQKRIQNGRQ